ncbi:hypothetical protein SLEP1_g53493 [Rubroshorea leprosula]|uniref:NB-ARC domain-containing protein n=1 Tax=Rubroshorea leprosula TaxID=152421 RepID=A0AAV5MDG0_9ROSI|nr:hypothetical protein SLEP1_g53493 [Rubroshorea leprosula]
MQDSLMDIITSVIDIVKDVGPEVKKYVKYQMRHNDYVSEFKEMQENLKHRPNVIDANLKTQQKQSGKIPNGEVEAWLKKADQETAESVVEDLICKGGCFTYICSSRKFDKKTQAPNGIFMQGENYANAGQSLEVEHWMEKASQQIAIKVEALISPGECPSSSNLEKKTEELKQTFEQGEKYTNAGESLVVYDHSIKGDPLDVEECSGRDDVQDRILEWLKGDEVIRIAVSGMGGVGKTTIMKQVHNQLFQKRIASNLEPALELKDPENVTKNAGMISQKLRQGSFVLILDDMWQPFSLEDVGIPNLVGNNGCKLVLTTRLQDVARAMECKVIPVNPLPPEEALALFLKKVGSEVLSDSRIKADIKPFLEQILQKCGGVPLAIVTVAKSMRGKLLPQPQCQECFLYCALYPEDAEITKEELIEYWIEEGLIYKEGKTREAMNLKGHDILDKLVDNCLLELVGYNEDCVSMHDLLREMALEINQFFVKAGIALEKLPEEDEWRDCLKISTIPEAFFENMLGLKILGLSNNHELSRLPTSVSKLEKLTTLLLGDCESLREVPSLSNFIGLKKLDLSWTSIEELPQGLNMLTNLKYLGLGGRISETLDELLQNLSKLQHLTINTRTKSKWEKIESWRKLQNLEKLDLCNLDNLNTVFGEVVAVAKSAPLPAGTFSSLQYIRVWGCDKIKKLFSVRWLGYLQKLQTIYVHNCKQLEEIIGSESEEGEKVTLPNLERLKLTELPQLKSIYSGSLICNSIKKIEIWNCDNIESVFGSRFNPLPNLEYLYLSQLKNLKSVFDEEGLGLSPLVFANGGVDIVIGTRRRKNHSTQVTKLEIDRIAPVEEHLQQFFDL